MRTGEDGFGGISLLLIDRNAKGVSVRKMETQFDNAHSTTFITFEDVEVPVNHLIGEENSGFMLILTNFNHERFIIAAGACRAARLCYELAFKYAMSRETFGEHRGSACVVSPRSVVRRRRCVAVQASRCRRTSSFGTSWRRWRVRLKLCTTTSSEWRIRCGAAALGRLR